MHNLSLSFTYNESDVLLNDWVNKAFVEKRPIWIDRRLYIMIYGGQEAPGWISMDVRRASLYDIACYLIYRFCGLRLIHRRP